MVRDARAVEGPVWEGSERSRRLQEEDPSSRVT